MIRMIIVIKVHLHITYYIVTTVIIVNIIIYKLYLYYKYKWYTLNKSEYHFFFFRNNKNKKLPVSAACVPALHEIVIISRSPASAVLFPLSRFSLQKKVAQITREDRRTVRVNNRTVEVVCSLYHTLSFVNFI